VATLVGFTQLWRYEGAAGTAAAAPMAWPAGSHLVPSGGWPTLVVAMHPQCPCSRATVEELAKLMATCHERLNATVLMIRPKGFPRGWEQTDLWRSAAAIPGVTVLADEDGIEARRYGAETSGQALLYSTDGRLLFAGGITDSRGHIGDNAGRSTTESLVINKGVSTQPDVVARTPVFGCPLFGVNQETKSCPK
jgi:hypothetical protein